MRQNPAACVFTINPTSAAVPVSGGGGTVTVTALNGCVWTTVGQQPWITSVGGTNGNGDGSTTFTVAANTGPPRKGTLSIAGEVFTVTQESGCAFSVAPTSQSVGATGGSGSAGVKTEGGCVWDARSEAPWITLTAGAQGSGPGSVTFDIAPHTGPARTGTLFIAGATFTVTQASGCTFGIQPTMLANASAAGQSGSTNVLTSPGCEWTATTNESWITFPNGDTGTGPGSFAFDVHPNSSPERTGSFFVQGQEFRVTQADGCTYALRSSQQDVGAGGGSFDTTMDTGPGCPWTASSNVPWITLTSGSGAGTGPLSFTVGGNAGPARQGTITVRGQTLTVNQASGCTFSVTPTSANVAAAGGTGTANVSTVAGCDWTASSNAPWITITSGASGSGSGSTSFTVQASSGPARTGTLTIAGQTFAVNQASGCSFSVAPTSANVAGAGGTGTANVSTAAGCAWTASSNEPWITITSGASGSGSGSTSFTVQASSGPARTGTLTIAGQTFTVNQASGCSFSVAPTSANVAAAGAGVTANVTTGTGCAWTASSNAPWITITSGASGSGSGSTSFTVQATTGPARTGTLTIAGQTFTVNQASGCTFAVAPTSANVAAAGALVTANVTTAPGCAWTSSVAGTSPWITITSGATGNGSGSTSFTVQATTGPARTGTLTIAGQTFTVNQASGCTYTLSPNSLTFGSAGGTALVTVSTSPGCAWTATTGESWIQIAPGQGTGSASVTIGITASLATRTGTVTIGGQQLTIRQN